MTAAYCPTCGQRTDARRSPLQRTAAAIWIAAVVVSVALLLLGLIAWHVAAAAAWLATGLLFAVAVIGPDRSRETP